MSKYKITEIEHPKYPWLHRIQALIDVNEKVPKGTLGGFVENENNLSQEGTCWIYDDAICCENGEVKEEAALYDGSLVRGYAVVTGDTTFYDRYGRSKCTCHRWRKPCVWRSKRKYLY